MLSVLILNIYIYATAVKEIHVYITVHGTMVHVSMQCCKQLSACMTTAQPDLKHVKSYVSEKHLPETCLMSHVF